MGRSPAVSMGPTRLQIQIPRLPRQPGMSAEWGPWVRRTEASRQTATRTRRRPPRVGPQGSPCQRSGPPPVRHTQGVASLFRQAASPASLALVRCVLPFVDLPLPPTKRGNPGIRCSPPPGGQQMPHCAAGLVLWPSSQTQADHGPPTLGRKCRSSSAPSSSYVLACVAPRAVIVMTAPASGCHGPDPRLPAGSGQPSSERGHLTSHGVVGVPRDPCTRCPQEVSLAPLTEDRMIHCLRVAPLPLLHTLCEEV